MGVSSRRECRKDEQKRTAPHSPLLASGALGATGLSQPLNNGLGRALCALGRGGEGQFQHSLVQLQVQGKFQGTSVNLMGKVS